MATAAKAIRADDVSGLNIRTFSISEAAETRHIQSIAISDGDDGTPVDVVGESTFPKGMITYGFDGTVARALRTNTSGQLDVRPLTTSDAVTATLATGDNTAGRVKVTDGTTVATVSPGGRLRVETAAKTSDDAAFAIATDDGYPVFALADEVATDSVDEGDVGVVRMTLDRKLLTRVVGATDANRLDVDASGHAQVDIAAASVAVPVTDNSGSLTVDAPVGTPVAVRVTNDAVGFASVATDRATAAAPFSNRLSDGAAFYDAAKTGQLPSALTASGNLKAAIVESTATVTVDSELPAAAALADATANPTIPSVGSLLLGFDGTDWERLRCDATTRRLEVEVENTPTVTDGGSGKTLKRAVVNTSTSGADVVAAVATKRIKVYQYAIQATGTVNANLRDGGAGSALTLTWNLQAREGVVGAAVDPPAFLFATTAGNALQVVLSAAVTTGVEVSYWDDDAA